MTTTTEIATTQDIELEALYANLAQARAEMAAALHDASPIIAGYCVRHTGPLSRPGTYQELAKGTIAMLTGRTN